MKKTIVSLILVTTMLFSANINVNAATKRQVEFIVTTMDGVPIKDFTCNFADNPPITAESENVRTYTGNTDKNGRLTFDVPALSSPYKVFSLHFSTQNSEFKSLQCTMPNGIIEEMTFSKYGENSYAAEKKVHIAGEPLIKLDFNTTSTFFIQVDTASKPNPKVIPFKGGTVIEAHSLDYANRSYHKITDRAVIADIASKLNEYTPEVSKDENCVGFLIVTAKGKYEYYLPNNEKTASAKDKPLIITAKNCNRKYLGSAQWLSFMTTSNIVRVTYSGSSGKNLSLKTPTQSVLESYVQVDTTDTAEIQVISAFLKGLIVKPKPTIKNSMLNSQASGYFMSIEFKSGTVYNLFVGTNGISISTIVNKKAESISYTCTENQIIAMLDMFSNLNSAVFSEVL